VIYNVRENTWYDTPIDRSGGNIVKALPLQIWADAVANSASGSTGYRLFRHEVGVDKVIADEQTAIRSFFETSQFGFVSGGPGGQGAENPNVNTRVLRIEPDMIQEGIMEAWVVGKKFPLSDTEVESERVEFEPAGSHAHDPDEPLQHDLEHIIDLRFQSRLPRLHMESNVQGGDYFSGKTLIHMEPGDERP
jgi:hypothetical protein